MPLAIEWEEIPIALEVLDALVERYLSEFARVWVNFDREQKTLGSVIYRLRHDQLGDSGTINLYKVGEQKSTMKIHDPPRLPDRDPTPEEQKTLAVISDREEKLKAHTRLREKIRAERDALYLRRRKCRALATKALFQGMSLSPAWQVAMGKATTEDDASNKLRLMNTKLDALLGQTTIRMDQSQLAVTQAVLNAIEAGRVPETELQETLTAMQHTLSEIRQRGAALPDPALASEIESLSEVFDAPKLDAKHKLKITVPIIPFLLSYEGEVELKSGLNLEAAWKRLVARVQDT